jgi:hypothetical protein
MLITNCRACNAQISPIASVCPQCGHKPSPSWIRLLLPIYFWSIFTGFQADFFNSSQIFFNYGFNIYNYKIPLFLSPFILIPFVYARSIIKGSLFILLILVWASFTFGDRFFLNQSTSTSLLQSLESREDVSNYTIDGELASAFVLNSKNTDVQRENLLKEIKDKIIIWDVKVYEVKKLAEKVYRIQTSDSGMFIGKKVVGTFIEITAKDTLEANFIEQVKTDQIIRIKGIFTGDSSARNLNIKPAILWNHESKLKSDHLGTNPTKEEVIISIFSRCNGNFDVKRCEAIENALLNEQMNFGIQLAKDERINRSDLNRAKYLENVPEEAIKYFNIYNKCMNDSEIVNSNTVHACSGNALKIAEKDMKTVLEKIYVKFNDARHVADALQVYQPLWEIYLNAQTELDSVNIGPPQAGITQYTLTAQRIKFLESLLNKY